MFSYWVEMAASAGVGVLILSIKKWKFRFFLNVGN